MQTDKVDVPMKAIVTGHSRGLGRAVAQALLERGIAVLGLSRGAAPQLAERYPALLTEVALDLADLAALQAWLAGDAVERFYSDTGTAILINNAGLVEPVGALPLQDVADVARAVSVNVAAPMMLAAAVAGQGAMQRIVHLSSGAAQTAYPGWSVYGATKAALDHHARCAAADGVASLRICSVAPGVIDTDMQAQLRQTTPERFPLRERFVQLHTGGELTSPERCARQLVDFVLGERFGHDSVVDLRSLSP